MIIAVIAVFALFQWVSKKEAVAPSSVSVTSPETAAENIVLHTDKGFSPPAMTVKVGSKVIFKNQGDQPVWPASVFHPVHKAYPTTGGCIGSTFDACKPLQKGEEWQFTFDIPGTWKYHNHLNPPETGTIIVEK